MLFQDAPRSMVELWLPGQLYLDDINFDILKDLVRITKTMGFITNCCKPTRPVEFKCPVSAYGKYTM